MRKLKTFFLRTYGCQMNELDSEIMVGALQKRGLVRVEEEENADLMLFNTCSIRDLAERKVMGKLGILGLSVGKLKKERPIIGVTGCMAMAKKERLFRKLPHVDFVLGTNNISDLNMVLDEVLSTQKQVLKTDSTFEENLNYLEAIREDKVKASVSIIRGCDKYCTYCVVPYTRGEEVSRSAADIEKECRFLVDQGYKEITLLGQNVNSYGKDFDGKEGTSSLRFHDLLYQLDKIEGLKRIRFMTSHPCDITLELMQAIASLPSVCEFVHFPLQAGSDRILRKMNRKYTSAQYLEKVATLKQLIPHASLGTDIIVGFPSETDEEFEMTYTLFKEIRYDVAFLFEYSARKGTPAYRWKDDISPEVKNERLQRLLSLYQEISSEKLQALVGTKMEVLVERKNKEDRQLQGRSRCWKKIIFQGDPSLIGSLQTVSISGYNHQTLIGSLE